MSAPRPSGRLRALLAQGRYHSYAYGYPHKTAYRALPTRTLAEVWAGEPRDALSLYLHVPFCEQRCGFCNLYTVAWPGDDRVRAWTDALQAEADAVAAALPGARWARLALGGGTPTWLAPDAFADLFALTRRLGVGEVPTSVETSPATLTDAHVDVLRSHRVRRVSVGVQGLDSTQLASVGRAQSAADVRDTLHRLRDAVPVRNADLIYGLAGQTPETFLRDIATLLDHGANELYLYPLYVRPETSLGRSGRHAWDDERLTLYRAGRDWLRARGWTQLTMRCFRAPGPRLPEPPYRCQEDGMVGLGAGARSYTRRLHFATPFAVRQAGVRAAIDTWAADPTAVHHGIELDEAEQIRRWVILSLLEAGLDSAAFRARFGIDVQDALPELDEAVDLGLLTPALTLTDAGREASDVIGAWLQSEAVVTLRDGWAEA